MGQAGQQIQAKVAEISELLVEWRRQIHQFPELGLEEFQTSQMVAKLLKQFGLEVYTGIGRTGVVGVLTGSKPGPVIALRADMDALPIQEENDVPYASLVPGKMHACGHDAHTAILLGAAKVLAANQGQLTGKVVFIFQPSEELHPGGARAMVEAGVLAKHQVQAIFGLHVDPHLPTGTIGVKDGPLMAAADMFELSIQGKGGHGAEPHLTVDPVVTAAQVIMGLQTISSRQVDPVQPVVVTVASIHGGEAGNVIPQTVTMQGTVRTLDTQLRDKIVQQMENTIQGICQAMGAKFNFDYQPGYPPVLNHREATNLVRQVGQRVLGPQGVIELAAPSMGGEDFAYYLAEVPGSFFYLGVSPGSEIYPWHHPKFALDEGALPVGVTVLVETVFTYLQKERR